MFINLIVQDNRWSLHKKCISNFAKSSLEEISNIIPLQPSKFECSILLTNDQEIQKLNQKFRGKNKPTNTLSFPDKTLDYKKLSDEIFPSKCFIGDIAISYCTIEKESQDFVMHTQRMVLHSILHLFGFDHEKDEDAVIMENLERQILEKLFYVR